MSDRRCYEQIDDTIGQPPEDASLRHRTRMSDLKSVTGDDTGRDELTAGEEDLRRSTRCIRPETSCIDRTDGTRNREGVRDIPRDITSGRRSSGERSYRTGETARRLFIRNRRTRECTVSGCDARVDGDVPTVLEASR